MKISFSSRYQYEKAFMPMKIVPNKTSGTGHYNIFDEKDNFVGEFTFYKYDNIGFVEDLKIPNKLRRSIVSANALFSVKNFILNQAKEKNLELIRFSASTENPFNVVRLYKKLFPNVQNVQVSDSIEFAYPVSQSGERRAKKLLSEFKEMVDNFPKIRAEF